jgi:type VI secretion system secreted protein Hcp
MAFDAFLKLGDGSKAKGESTDAKHAGEIAVLEFQIGVTNASSVGSATTGSGTGKAQFNALRIVKPVDKSSPILLQMCASGDHFPTAMLTLRKAGGKNPVEYLIYTFTQVYVTSVDTHGITSQTDIPGETIEFSYATVHEKYTPQKADGSADSPIEGGWDLVTNQPK